MAKTITVTLPDPENSSLGLQFTIVNVERDGKPVSLIRVSYQPDTSVQADVTEFYFDELPEADQLAVGQAGYALLQFAKPRMGY